MTICEEKKVVKEEFESLSASDKAIFKTLVELAA